MWTWKETDISVISIMVQMIHWSLVFPSTTGCVLLFFFIFFLAHAGTRTGTLGLCQTFGLKMPHHPGGTVEMDDMVFIVKWTCTSRLSLKAFDQNHCSKLLNIYSQAQKKSLLNSSGAPWVYIRFGYLSKNTIIYNNRMMSKYSARFILYISFGYL